MRKYTTSDRLKEIMEKRNLKQVDILNKCKPYCEEYGVKLNKNDLSQYVSGKVTPKQDKLSILGAALGVSEVWLMGYDIPDAGMDTKSSEKILWTSKGNKIAVKKKSNKDYSSKDNELIKQAHQLNDRGYARLMEYLSMLMNMEEYCKNESTIYSDPVHYYVEIDKNKNVEFIPATDFISQNKPV